MLAGLDAETPLGRIVSVRSENNAETLKNFTPEMKQIRSQWRTRQTKEIQQLDPEHYDKVFDNMSAMLQAMFS